MNNTGRPRRTQCRKGHELAGESYRNCKVCAQLERQAAARAARIPTAPATPKFYNPAFPNMDY